MRIIGGAAKGRQIVQPKSVKTRPLSDLAREGLFNILGSVTDFIVLDCFAGSGAVGLEALSRGAKTVDAIEVSRSARQIIGQNVNLLGYNDQYHLHPTTVEKWLTRQQPASKYDLIFIGAPFGYELGAVLERVAPLLKTDGMLVVEWFRKSKPIAAINHLKLKQQRQFGESVLAFYQS